MYFNNDALEVWLQIAFISPTELFSSTKQYVVREEFFIMSVRKNNSINLAHY